MICPVCHAQIPDGTQVCPYCGQTLVWQQPNPQQPYQQPAQPQYRQQYQQPPRQHPQSGQPYQPQYRQPQAQPQFQQQAAPKKRSLAWLYILLGVIALAGIGVGLFFLLSKPAPAPEPSVEAPTETRSPFAVDDDAETAPTSGAPMQPLLPGSVETEPPIDTPPDETEPEETEPPEAEEGHWELSEMASYNSSGKQEWREVYEYDAQGRVSKYWFYNYAKSDGVDHWWENQYDADGCYQTMQNEYDAAGNMVVSRYYDADGHSKRYDIMEYDEDGHMIEAFHYSADGELQREEYYTYDAQGNLVWYYRVEGGKVAQNTEYTYDAEGHQTGAVYYDEDGNVDVRLEYKLRSDGKPYEEISSMGTGELNYTCSYTYDEYGNCIRRETVLADGSASYSYVMTYVYFS